MRIFSLIPALTVLVTAVAGAPPPADSTDGNCGYEIGCEVAQSAAKRDFFELPTRTVHGLTNAALLRRGLPLKNPVMRRGTPVRRTDPSTVPEPEPQPNPEPEPGKISHRGIIQVKSLSDDSVIGYISKSPIGPAQYRYSTNTGDALIVNFETDSTGSGTQLNLFPENSDVTNSDPVGLVQGRDDTDSILSSGSFHYLYLTNAHETASGALPEVVGNSYSASTGTQRTSESAVWTYESATGRLSPHWINPDGSIPAIEYFLQSTAIYLGGDANAFQSRYPAPVTSITFEFVEI